MPLDLDTRQRAMLKEMGVEVWLPGPSFAPQNASAPSQPTRAVPKAAPNASVTPAPRAASGQPNSQSNDLSKINTLDWEALADTASQCQACGLCGGRKNSTLVAMPDGALATWMVVGDPPDEEEDASGTPFAGEAGLLLDNMLKAVGAMRMGAGEEGGAPRSQALVTNITKCRPPQGRIPQGAELAQCAAYLQREIALAQPKLIVVMGRFACQVLLAEHPDALALPLGKQRGVVYRYQGIAVVVTYTPKALLRSGADKAKAWADLCLAMAELEKA